MSTPSQSRNLVAAHVRRSRVVCSAVAAALALSAACSASAPLATPEVPTVARRVDCIELTKRGLVSESVNGSLVELAVADAKRAGKSLKLYKVVVGPSSSYYVFAIKGWSDTYTVYETDAKGSQFVGKYQYGSLHYPCPVPGSSAQPIQQPPKVH